MYWWCSSSTGVWCCVCNLFLGVPFSLDDTLRSHTGSFFVLLNPFALVCGIVSLSSLQAHGVHGYYVPTVHYITVPPPRQRRSWQSFLCVSQWVHGYTLATLRVMPTLTAVNTNAAPVHWQRCGDQYQSSGWMNNHGTYPLPWPQPGLQRLWCIAGTISAGKTKSCRKLYRYKPNDCGAILTAGFGSVPIPLIAIKHQSSVKPDHVGVVLIQPTIL